MRIQGVGIGVTGAGTHLAEGGAIKRLSICGQTFCLVLVQCAMESLLLPPAIVVQIEQSREQVIRTRG